MICQRCQKSLRISEGVKCDDSESRFHMKCVNESVRDHREAGDRAERGHHWRCALCNNSTSKTYLENPTSRDNEHLMNAINIITEKFELVNKIQLPKLNNDLMHLKTMTERIAKQNEDILRKMDEFEKRKGDESHYNCTTSYGHRRRSLNITPRINQKNANYEHEYLPILPTSDKTARYRTRRRSYILQKMFHLLNNKINKSRTPRRKL